MHSLQIPRPHAPVSPRRPAPRLRLEPTLPESPWSPGLLVGGPADGEQGPLDGDRVTLVRGGVVHRYAVLQYRGPTGRSLRAWIYAGHGSEL